MTRRGNNSGFTLVEMLIAMLICAIAVALVVSVGADVQRTSRADETRAIQAVLAEAIRAYYDAGLPWPPGEGGPASSASLLGALQSEPAAQHVLARLPDFATRTDDSGRMLLYDGFDQPMRYSRTGGVGRQSPLLLSYGEDRQDPTDDIFTDVD
jgi:prepilin-type N-terminal cleavage/methylation domain-containing protein